MSANPRGNEFGHSIKLGIAVSLSGRYALLGRQVLAGLECFVEDVNAAGGISVADVKGPRQVKLIVRDDRSDPGECERMVGELIDGERIDLLMGPYGSGLTQAAAGIAESARMVMWNHSGSADQIFDVGFRWVVGIISPASSYLCAVLDLVRARDPLARRVALCSADTGFARDAAAGVESWIAQAGFTLCAHHRYPSGQSDFRALVRSLADDPPDCLLGVGRVEDDLQLARDLVELRPPIKAIGLVVAAIDHFHQELGGLADGFLAPSQWEPNAAYMPDCGPRAEDFVDRFRQRYPDPPDYPAAQGYIGALIAQQCVEAAGTLDQGALREAANHLRCTTFYGPYGIDAASGRQHAHGILVTQWQAGRRRIVSPHQAAEAGAVYPGPWWH